MMLIRQNDLYSFLFLKVYTLTCLGSVTTANREYQVAFQRENRDLP